MKADVRHMDPGQLVQELRDTMRRIGRIEAGGAEGDVGALERRAFLLDSEINRRCGW